MGGIAEIYPGSSNTFAWVVLTQRTAKGLKEQPCNETGSSVNLHLQLTVGLFVGFVTCQTGN